MGRSLLKLSCALTCLLFAAQAGAAGLDSSPQAPARDDHVALDAIPQSTFAVSGFGTPSGIAGVSASSGLRTSAGVARDNEFIGGLSLFGSPIDRLTLFGTVENRLGGEYAPSIGLSYRLLGSRQDGWAIAAGLKYKTEGFAEIGGETELGVFGSYNRDGWFGDANAVVGAGIEERESDGEFRLRLGRQVVGPLRVGVDGQARYRLAGDKALAGARHWDAAGGVQVGVTGRYVYGQVTAGPSTMSVASGVGWVAIATVGAVTW
jgi:hypothetical protein